ncbi:MAG: ubiquinone/menaquinone biosynthesis methyltransferase [Chthoniobacteraceae bacterium]|nr:ubiquinone/menaquinone biosynthesis methyltransferase [Chthoniobacteraceae bacterium]
MQEPSFVQHLFGAIARRYDLANHLLSGGLDFLWRRRVARIVAGWQPETLLDLATGSGDIALALRRRMPRVRIVGADFCVPMLREAVRKGVDPVIAADGLALPFADAVFDGVTVAFGLRNMASWPGALREMRRVLRPGGHLLILDFSLPPAPLRWVYRPYLHRVLPWIAGRLTGERAAYEYLGDSIERFPSGAAMCALLEEAGFASPRAERLSCGIVSLYTATAA